MCLELVSRASEDTGVTWLNGHDVRSDTRSTDTRLVALQAVLYLGAVVTCILNS